MTMRLPVFRLVALLPLAAPLLLACPEGPSQSEASAPPCDGAQTAGWLFDVAAHPAPEKMLGPPEGGWALLYQRKYVDAIHAFRRAPEPTAALAAQRTEVLLGRLYRRLGRFTASSLVRYFKERDALGSDASALKHRPFFEHVSHAVLGQLPERAGRVPRGPYRRMVRAWPKRCPDTWPAKLNVFQAVAHRLACGPNLGARCPDVRVPTRPMGYGHRVVAYYRALCGRPSTAEIAALRRLAATPETTEEIVRTVQGEPVRATFAYYDPVALFVLADVYLRRAQESATATGRAARLVSAWAARERHDHAAARALLAQLPAARDRASDFFLSEWRNARALETSLSSRATTETSNGTADAAGLVDAFRAARAKYTGAAACGPSEAGRQVATELQLARGLAAAEVRRALPELSDEPSCQQALPVLRATADRGTPDRPSWLNEPGFLVRLAEAAQCMGRSSEAIGALNAIETEYPEARAALAAAESLAVVRVMGGSVGTQRTP